MPFMPSQQQTQQDPLLALLAQQQGQQLQGPIGPIPQMPVADPGAFANAQQAGSPLFKSMGGQGGPPGIGSETFQGKAPQEPGLLQSLMQGAKGFFSGLNFGG